LSKCWAKAGHSLSRRNHMESAVPIKIALANVGDLADPGEIFKFIETGSTDLETYELDGSKVTAAAIDYLAILSAVGSVASVASLLWMAYEKFIASRKRPESDAGLYIVISLTEHEHIEFWIGKTHKDREKFIKEFTVKVTAFRKTRQAQKELEEMKRDIARSGVWKKRK
jgi:hypothetical protein